jgi:16S rRNA (uracil1498-N3)-methyltransferase
MKPGDEAFVFDGEQREYQCRVSRFDGRLARLDVIDEMATVVESPLNLTLAQALVKGDKFDWIVQKATELGVTSIVPLITLNGDVKWIDERGDRTVERWRRISLEAIKQCGRRRLASVHAPMTPVECLKRSSTGEPVLVFNEREGSGIEESVSGVAGSLTAFIGPEGGWADQELEPLRERGAKMVTLGPRVLRTETAAVVALTLIQHRLGDVSR